MNARSFPVHSALRSLAIVSLIVGGLASQSPPPGPLTVLSREGARPLPIVVVNDLEFVAVDDLAAVFRLTVREQSPEAVAISYNANTIVLTSDQALVTVAGRQVSLPAAPSRAGPRWLVPLEFINRALALIYDARLDLRKTTHLLVVGDLRVPRLTIRYDLFGGGGRLTIDSTGRAGSTVTQQNNRLTIKFDVDALDLATPPLAVPTAQDLVRTIRLSDPTTITVELGPRFGGFRASTQAVESTTRLVVDIVSAQTDAFPAPVVPPPQAVLPDVPPSLTASGEGIRTIAIDPGHGGTDEGVKGARGTKEKDLTLAIGRRVKSLIEARLGIRVLLTRDDDRNVEIDDRTAIANNNKADLFVSLHANASLRKSAAGASVYCAAFGEDALRIAAAGKAERLPTFGGGARDIDVVLWDVAQMRHLDRSVAFATLLERQLRDRVRLAPQSIEHAPLRVLESANMPAVLVEIGFLTNRDQETQIAGAEFQSIFVQAVFDAVVKFRDSLSVGSAR